MAIAYIRFMARNDLRNKLTVREFFKRFPDEGACLEHIMDVRFGLKHICRQCQQDSTFHKLEMRKAYCCAHCGDNLYPCAGTIFQDSRTPLQVWFYAVFLFIATRHGVSAKELQRQLGVTYKCAYRMGHKIRDLMAKADVKGMLEGHVEMDEAYQGGFRSPKTVLFGMKERDGNVRAEVVPNRKMATVREVVLRNVKRGSVVSTDEFVSYDLLAKDGYRHGKVNHSKKQWSHRNDRYGVTHHTNSIENFWGLFKASVRGTHIHISKKYTEKYLNEFAFRSNRREMGNAMFDLLIGAL